MSSTIYRYAGLGTEATFGTAVPATIHCDITGASLDVPGDPNLYYEGGLNRSRQVVKPGFYAPEGNIEMGPTATTLPLAFYWALGGGTLAQSYGSASTLLPSFTARIGKDLYEHVFTGCTVNTLSLNVDDSFAEMTLDVVAQKDEKTTITPASSLILDTQPIIAFHEVQMTAGYTCANVRSLELNINNDLDAQAGKGCNSRHPYRIPAGAREVDLSLTLWFADDAELLRFWGGNAPSSNGPTEFPVVLNIAEFFQLRMPHCIVSDLETQPSGRDRIELSVTVKALLGELDGIETEIIAEEI